MSEQEIAIIIQSLRKAIERDKSYFVKAKVDKIFDHIRNDVNALLETILQETKVKAEQAILKPESEIQIMEKWFACERCDEYSLKDYTSACKKIRVAKSMLENGSYFSYLGAIQAVQDAEEKLATAQESIRTDLSSSEKMLEQSNNELTKIYDETYKVDKGITDEINTGFFFFVCTIGALIFNYWMYLNLGKVLSTGAYGTYNFGLIGLGTLYVIFSTPVVVLGSLHIGFVTISLLLSKSEKTKNILERLGEKQKINQIRSLEQRIQLAKESLI